MMSNIYFPVSFQIGFFLHTSGKLCVAMDDSTNNSDEIGTQILISD